MSITAVVKRNGIPSLMSLIEKRSRQNVEDGASDVRDLAAQLAPRDTGSLAESLYVSSSAGSDYSQRAAAAASRNPDAVIVPEVRPEFALTLFGTSGAGYTAIVGAAVEHGVFQEFGTRYQSAQPFLTPASEAMADQFTSAMQHVADV